jgi:hypothetical protein
MKTTNIALGILASISVSAVALAQQSPAPAPRGGDRTEQVQFDRADKNADGRVSREEANDIDGFDFSRADTNNDGSLTRQEYDTAMGSSTPRRD